MSLASQPDPDEAMPHQLSGVTPMRYLALGRLVA
jgi:hypothetical protein